MIELRGPWKPSRLCSPTFSRMFNTRDQWLGVVIAAVDERGTRERSAKSASGMPSITPVVERSSHSKGTQSTDKFGLGTQLEWHIGSAKPLTDWRWP